MNIPNTQNFFNPDYDKHGDGYIPDAMNQKTSASNNFTMQTQDLHERMSAASENEKNLNKYSNASGIIDNSNVNNSNPTANIVQQQVQQMSAPLQENRPTVIRSPASDMNATTVRMDMKGNVIWDSISDLDFYMTNGSTLEGAFVNDESNAGNGGDGYCNVVIDKDSTWTVTGDSTITSMSNAGTITDADGKTVSIVGTDGTTYVEGDSDYTITVGSYQDSADTSASTTVDDWSSYEVERPESL